jgi:DNA polymerase III delta subunit
MSLREVTAWEAALAIAQETEETTQQLCDAVLSGDFETAQLLARELKNESDSFDSCEHRIASGH